MSHASPARGRGRRVTDFDPETALLEHALSVRVRYVECDPMGVVHHSVYPVWFEMGRTEMLRAQGGSYRDLEAAGAFLVVAELSIRFQTPARYDETLRLRTLLLEAGRARLRHGYRLERVTEGEGRALVAAATTTIACVNAEGGLQAIPESVLATLESSDPSR